MTVLDHRFAKGLVSIRRCGASVGGAVHKTRTGMVLGMSRSDRWRFRLPLIASWVVIGGLLAQESAGAIITGGLSASVALPAFMVACGGYALLQRRTLTGSTRGRVVVTLLIIGASLLSFLVDGLWAGLPLAFAAMFLTLRPLSMLPAVLGFIAAIVTVIWFLLPHRFLVQMPIGLLAMGVTLHAFTYVSVLVRELQLTREELQRLRLGPSRCLVGLRGDVASGLG